MNLKGQNFRIFQMPSGASTPSQVVAMATNCVVTLTNNTEEAGTKDDVGMASLPVTVSKSWQVQVDSLNVLDMASILTSIKNLQPFLVMWDETSTDDNQTPQAAAYARNGLAYISDATFNFNDRENSSKSITFVGTSALDKITTPAQTSISSVKTYTKGQFVRLFLGTDTQTTPTSVIAFAKQLSVHVAMQLESASTKDTSGEWLIQEPVALSYDITTQALVHSGETITSSVGGKLMYELEEIYEEGDPVKFQIANVSGANQRTKGSIIMSGLVLITQLQMNAANKTDASYQATLQGYGAYTVSA